ncbi:MAG: glycoside hydrolase family 125 protein [Saprospiraceae bacterium]|nr:glycoside hydrolase family 125 protein [Saprospiraceae bacterium]
MYTRKQFIKTGIIAGTGLYFSNFGFSNAANTDFISNRPLPADRKFTSDAVEDVIIRMRDVIKDKQLSWLFENCFPNTLDTTVDFEYIDGKPDTYVITGDIDAMWLRDSTAQVWPYLPLITKDKKLQELIKGVIRRQVRCIILDPYANAFYKDLSRESYWNKDLIDMKPGIHERKWEIDSLCYPVRLAYGYWKQTHDESIFDNEWKKAMSLVLKTFREQQRIKDQGPYTFQRTTSWATDGVPLGGYGYPVRPNGLICSVFRPSDDCTIYPYLIPSNYFAVEILGYLSEIFSLPSVNEGKMANESNELKLTVKKALDRYAVLEHPDYGMIIPYEINGFGSFNFMDDANVPSLLSLPYLNCLNSGDQLYLNTRKYVLSANNPFYFRGTAAEGTGSPHTSTGNIWPMSIIMRGLTSNDKTEIKHCITTLLKTHAGTGFMHESFNQDDPAKFSRKWFAWANTLFGEFILQVNVNYPDLLKMKFEN